MPVPLIPTVAVNPYGVGSGYGLGPFGGASVVVYPTRPVPTEDEILGGHRVTEFTFDLLDSEENLLGQLVGVDPAGSSLKWDTTTAVKGAGTLVLHDTILDGISPATVAWADIRIRPWASIAPLDGSAPASLYPLGIWIPSAPKAQWTDPERQWSVSILDKTCLPDKDTMTDIDVALVYETLGLPAASGGVGDAVSFSLPSGSNIIQTIVAILQGMGESTAAIMPDPQTTALSQTWEAGTSKLVIINDLLAAAGYYSLWCDHQGQFQCTVYQLPVNVPPTYNMLAPFTDDTPLMGPTWDYNQDIYSIPNRYVGVSQGSSGAGGLVATAVNNDPNSPYSYAARGYWVTQTEKSINISNLGALQTYVQNKLQKAASPVATIDVQHILLPDLMINQTVQFKNDAQGVDQPVLVENMTVELDPTAMCAATFVQAIDVTVGVA